MWSKFSILAIFVLAIGAAGCTGEQYTQGPRGRAMKIDSTRVMTKQDVINMTKAGVSDSLIIGMMDETNSYFKLKSTDVIQLRKAGVSESVISAMMQPPPQASDNKSSASNTTRYYYTYPPYWWYSDFYPYWYYPSFSVRLGGYYHYPAFARHGRFHR